MNIKERREYEKQWRIRNRDKVLVARKAYEKRNRKKLNIKANKYYKENKDKQKIADKKYYKKNKEKIRQKNKEYQLNNKKPITEEQRKYNKNYHNKRYNNDIQYKIRTRLCNRFNNAIKKYKDEGKFVISRNKNLNYETIIGSLKPFPENIQDYHIDHIVPLNFFDLMDGEQLKKAWNPINFQWLLSSDNEIKGNIIDFKKYPKQEMVFNKLGLKYVYKHL